MILFNKPFGVLSQFTDAKSPTERPTLSAFGLPAGVYAAGRLDRDTEGDDGTLVNTWSYEGDPTEADLDPLRRGVTLNDGRTRPAKARLIDPPAVWERDPPVRFRKSVPDRWIEVTISEGRNRQVRRMTAAIGFPTLRLIRWRVGNWTVEGLMPGQWREAAL